MNWFWLVYAAFLILPGFFIWVAIHELSHFIAAKFLTDAKLLEMKLWPHIDPKAGFRWGVVRYTPPEAGPTTPKQQAAISFAPRLPNCVAVTALPLAFLLTNDCLFVTWTVLWAAGIIDLCNGSIGYSEFSDLKRGAKALMTSPWVFRSIGWTLALVSVGIWLFTASAHVLRMFKV